METWLKLSIWVAVYGFLKDCQPLDSYITQYLVDVMGFDKNTIMREIYPVATYVSLIELIFVFLLTDWLRYRPVIFVNAISYIGMMVMLIWFRSLTAMWAMEAFFATVLSTEVAYYTYIYTKVGKEHYQAVTSYMRTASLLGRCTGCFVGQVIYMNKMVVKKICYIQLFGAVATFLWAFILPPVKTSIYFYRYDSTILDKTEGKPVVVSNSDIIKSVENGYSPALKKVNRVPCSIVIRKLWDEFKYVYTNPYILKWSVWYALFLCGFNQEGTYSQTLWQHLASNENLELKPYLNYTGFTDSASTICGALTSFSSSYVALKGNASSDFLMGSSALLAALLILWTSITRNLWEMFLSHVLFNGVYFFALSIGYSEIAKNIPSDCYALVFGINTFISLVIQSFLTLVFNGKGGLEFESRPQFLVLSGFFFLLGFVFLLKCLFSLIPMTTSSKNTSPSVSE